MTDKAHWDGAAWTNHGYRFTAFFQDGDGAAYATARNADYTYSSYRYDGAAWTKLEGLPGALVGPPPAEAAGGPGDPAV